MMKKYRKGDPNKTEKTASGLPARYKNKQGKDLSYTTNWESFNKDQAASKASYLKRKKVK